MFVEVCVTFWWAADFKGLSDKYLRSTTKGSKNPAGIYLLKVNNRNTRTRCELCSNLTIKTLKRRQELFWCLYC